MNSKLQHQPKSVILEKGYINIYSELNPKERRQLEYKERYKKEILDWDETLVYLTNKFSSLCVDDAVVLDAGCGNGNYVIDENRHRIAWAVGVDVSTECTKKNICLDEIQVASLENLPFESNKFDVVVSLWVLEHLENPAKVFNEINRVLKPNGIFMFATPNLNYLPLKVMHIINSVKFNHLLNKYLFGREENDVFPTHYRVNSLKEIKTVINSNFSIEELRLNSDASYTAFNEITYKLTKILLKLPNIFSIFTHPHIIGILRKK